MQDHARKTVTIDPHPHESVSHASIHPCKHAQVMKRIMQMMESTDESGEGHRELRVDQYMIVFLKAYLLPFY